MRAVFRVGRRRQTLSIHSGLNPACRQSLLLINVIRPARHGVKSYTGRTVNPAAPMTSSLHKGGAANPVDGITRRATRFSTRLNGWMRRWSWAIAITVGGLVILESGRMRIAAEYETALDAKGATTQLTALAADIASLTADERAFRLAPDSTYTAHYNAAAARIKQTVASLDAYYRRKADDTALASFKQVSATLDTRINAGLAAR